MVAGTCLHQMSDGSESLASTVCKARRAALDGRVIKVKLAGEVQCYILEAVGDAWRLRVPYVSSYRAVST